MSLVPKYFVINCDAQYLIMCIFNSVWIILFCFSSFPLAIIQFEYKEKSSMDILVNSSFRGPQNKSYIGE